MGTYDTRGGSPASPDLACSGPGPVAEAVLGILEEAGLPAEVNDRIVALIEQAGPAAVPSGFVPLAARLENAVRTMARLGARIRFDAHEISSTGGDYMEIDPARGLDACTAFVQLAEVLAAPAPQGRMPGAPRGG